MTNEIIRPSGKGRTGMYETWQQKDNLTRLTGWARQGLTHEQIAVNIGVNVGTLYNWKKKYKKIDEALKKGKDVVDFEVENALLKRALGYSYEEVKTTVESYGDEEAEPKFKREITVKHVPADTTAQIFWLRNRKRLEWTNKDGVDVARVMAETDYTLEKTKLLKGLEKDTGMMDVLIGVMTEDEEQDKAKAEAEKARRATVRKASKERQAKDRKAKEAKKK